MLRIIWRDKEKNTEVLSKISVEETELHGNTARQNMAYAGHVLRGSSEINAALILEGKINGAKTRGRPRWNWIDDDKNGLM